MLSEVGLGLHIVVAHVGSLGYHLHFGLEGLECPLEVWMWYTGHCCFHCCYCSTPSYCIGTVGMHSHLWASLHPPPHFLLD